jgi:hypothetical protein
VGINPTARWVDGSTLTEVLIALMIASIGLVSVATLFPMSVLRSIKASQFTNAADVSVNANTAIDRNPDIINHPDSRNPLYRLPYPPAPYPPPPANYTTNDVDPPWSTMQLTGVKNYIVDPLGYAAVRNLNLTIGAQNANFPYFARPEHFFGNDPSGGNLPPWPANPPGTPWPTLPRYPLSWRPAPGVLGDAALAAADYLVTLPDSWVLEYETIGGTLGPGPVNYSQITLPGFNQTTSFSGAFANYPSPALRVVMFTPDGVAAQTRYVTFYDPVNNPNTLQWSEVAGQDINGNSVADTHYLPASFTSLLIPDVSGNLMLGKVRVEMQERRYTWLLTVRQSSSTVASVDVVVYFRRTLENIAVDELLYNAVFTQGSTQVPVTYPVGNNPATGLPLKPYMRRGSFVFDANNAFWYRIANVVDDNAGNAVLTLEVPANATTGNPPFVPPRAMFPRGVVDVFPLGLKSFQ